VPARRAAALAGRARMYVSSAGVEEGKAGCDGDDKDTGSEVDMSRTDTDESAPAVHAHVHFLMRLTRDCSNHRDGSSAVQCYSPVDSK